MKKSILFLLGLTGFVVSGVWLLQGGGHEPIVALCASLAALLTDFLWLSQDKISISYRWNAIKWLALIGAILLIPLLNYLFPKREDIPPKFDLAWYEQTESGLQIVDPNNVRRFLDPEDILKNRIRLPIHLALRNADNVPLQVVRVELHYEKGFEVSSSGKAKIDPDRRVLIYEHVIGTLEKVKEFTPFEAIDVVTVPYTFFVTPTVALTKDNVPQYVVVIASEGLLRERHVNLAFRVFCANRPPVTGQVRIRLDAKLQVFIDLQNSERIDVNEADHRYFATDLQHAKTLTQWSRRLSKSGQLIDYKMVQSSESKIQFISVDGTLRKVAVDYTNDGNIDFTLVDSDGDNKPDFKYVFHKPWPLLDWKAEAAE